MFNRRFTASDLQALRARNISFSKHSEPGEVHVPIPRRGRMNKLETSRDQYLKALQYSGSILDCSFELFKVRLATGAWYCWDFTIRYLDGHIVAEDVKGYMWDRDMVRITVAAKELARFGIELRVVRRIDGQWQEKTINPD